jgi:hypothetical protein
MKKLLRALAFTGLLGITAAAAQAQVRVYAGVRVAPPMVVAAVPPCPGVGYVWTPGYYAGAVWYPGRWAYRGYDHGYYAHGYRYGYGYRYYPRYHR